MDNAHPQDIWVQFTDALPVSIRDTLGKSIPNLAALATAVRRGWTIPRLVSFTTGPIGPTATNPAGIVAHRLREAAGRPPTTNTTRRATVVQTRGPQHQQSWCGTCDDPNTRWLEYTDDAGYVAVRRCACWSPITGSVANGCT